MCTKSGSKNIPMGEVPSLEKFATKDALLLWPPELFCQYCMVESLNFSKAKPAFLLAFA